MVGIGCTVYQLLYLVQASAALGVAEQARAGDVVRGEGLPENPAEFAALEGIEFRVEDDVHQHLLHLRDRDAFEAASGDSVVRVCRTMQPGVLPNKSHFLRFHFVSACKDRGI